MSLETWCKKFYPSEAKPATVKEAVDRSIRKWVGLRPANLDKHGLHVSIINPSVIEDHRTNKTFTVCASHCPLCLYYNTACRRCILTQYRKGAACDVATETEYSSPWHEWYENSDPEPMLQLLWRVKRWITK